MNLETSLKQRETIKSKGIVSVYLQHVAYYYRLYRKGLITEKQYHENMDSIRQTMGS